LEHDNILTGFASARLQEKTTSLPMRAGRGLYRGFIWAEQSNTLLVASGPGAFISTIAFNMSSVDPEPRIFSVKNPDGISNARRVGMVAFSTHSLIGDPKPDDNGGWTAKRMYNEQANKLAADRRFVQYRPTEGDGTAGRRKALDDL